jgi:hypothetical protein
MKTNVNDIAFAQRFYTVWVDSGHTTSIADRLDAGSGAFAIRNPKKYNF